MTQAKILLNQRQDLSERFRVELKVFEVESSNKFPDGIKVRFVLLDVIRKEPRLLIDNHEPYGFHVHQELPGNKNARRILNVSNYFEALDEFWRLTKEIITYEN